MGAGTTEVRDSTTDVLLEAAVWDPAAVSRTQRRLHLHSEAGRRYERTVDPAISVAALDRCAALLADIAGGTVEPTLTDWRGDPPRDDWSHPPVSMPSTCPTAPPVSTIRTARPQKRLTQIGAEVVVDGDRVTATPPSWRPDIRAARRPGRGGDAAGGARRDPVGAARRPAGRGSTPCQKRRRAIGKSLALNGYVEVLPTPFLAADIFDLWGLPADDPRRRTTQVLNPLESDRPELATTLLPGLAGSAGAQRLPRGGRRRAVRDRPGRGARPRKPVPSNASRTTAGPPTKRSPMLDASLPAPAAARRRRCWPACANPRARGVRAARSRPPTRSRQCASSAAPPAWS